MLFFLVSLHLGFRVWNALCIYWHFGDILELVFSDLSEIGEINLVGGIFFFFWVLLIQMLIGFSQDKECWIQINLLYIFEGFDHLLRQFRVSKDGTFSSSMGLWSGLWYERRQQWSKWNCASEPKWVFSKGENSTLPFLFIWSIQFNHLCCILC